MYESYEVAPPWVAPPPPTPDSEPLPMVVWLTGAEPYFETFSLDADAVMERLGLKRSRLTQISGKELRVGRAKMGRYIRPVYRDCDIEAYLAWVKPTSSHKKSSSVIEEAVQHLETQTEVSLRSLQTLLGDFSTQSRAIFGHELAQQTRQLQTALHHQRQEIVPPLSAQLTHSTHVTLRVEATLTDLQRRVEMLTMQQREFLSIQEALTRILSLVQMQQSESAQHWRTVQAELEKMRELDAVETERRPCIAKASVIRWYREERRGDTPYSRPSLSRKRSR